MTALAHSGQPEPVLICVDPARVAELWHVIAPLLDKGYEACGEFMPDTTLDKLRSAEWLVWVVVVGDTIIAAMTTRLLNRRDGKACQLLCCGGDQVEIWNHHMRRIEDYARAEGCTSIIAEGRKGWLRVLDGFSVFRVKFQKVL